MKKTILILSIACLGFALNYEGSPFAMPNAQQLQKQTQKQMSQMKDIDIKKAMSQRTNKMRSSKFKHNLIKYGKEQRKKIASMFKKCDQVKNYSQRQKCYSKIRGFKSIGEVNPSRKTVQQKTSKNIDQQQLLKAFQQMQRRGLKNIQTKYTK